ncbi:MAG: holo-ACP synthase [Blastocatellia bacterium]|nr:holo-ACP synthase [Blastocatellia bacterium]
MIISAGIDIIEVYRIRDAVARTPRFAERVFTAAEREYCNTRGAGKFQSYSARFAAKEAFLKALKTGWRGKLGWQDIEVRNDDLGAPAFSLHGEATALTAGLGVSRIHLSMSHTTDHAVAQVIFEG